MGEFSDGVSEWVRNVRRQMDEIAQEYAEKGGHFVVDATPAITGKLKGGWYFRVNSDDIRPSQPVDPTGAITKALMSAEARNIRWGDRIEIVNDVIYGFWVDQGTRYFEGRDMVGRTITYLEGLDIGF